MSAVLKRIISGELVQVEGREIKGAFPGRVARAVIADSPVPLRPPTLMAVNLKTGRWGFVVREFPKPPLRSFKTLLDNPTKWREVREDEERATREHQV